MRQSLEKQVTLPNYRATKATRGSGLILIPAAVGAMSVLLTIYTWTGWISSDVFGAAPKGADEMQHWKLVGLRMFEALSVGTAAYIIWRYLVHPFLKERSLTFDGMMVLGGLLSWWADPLCNYYNIAFIYNTNAINLRSWAPFIPGIETPKIENFAEPITVAGGAYIWWILGASLLGCALLRWIRRTWPTVSLLRMFVILTGIFIVMDTIFEVILMRAFEVWAYVGWPRSITLWYGSQYQFPIIEPVATAVFMSACTALRWFRDDRGISWAERGASGLGLGQRASKAVSLLAVTGGVTLAVLLFYVIWLPFALKADTAPPLPSYLRAEMCGTGTGYACPSEYVPQPSKKSLHVGPDDPGLPEWVRERQGISP